MLPVLLTADVEWSIGGFGTMGGAYQGNEAVVYRTSTRTQKGSSGHFSTATDTKFGLQVDAVMNDAWSATLQGVATHIDAHGADTYIEWANIKYDYSANLYVRGGRMRLPMFMYSDVVNTSYAYPWLRLPAEVYSSILVTNYDGAEVGFSRNFGSCNLSMQIYYGRNDDTIKTGYDASENMDFALDNIAGFASLLAWNDWKIRLSYMHPQMTIGNDRLNGLMSALRQYGYGDLANDLEIHKKWFHFGGLGVSYDGNGFFATGEYARIWSKSVLGDIQAWYASAGWHVNEKITPYVVYGQIVQHRDIVNTASPPLNGMVDQMLSLFCIEQKTSSFGVRYDFRDSASLKLQYDHLSFDAGASIHLTGRFQNENLDVFSVVVDFAF